MKSIHVQPLFMSSSCWSWLWFTSLLCGKGFSFSSFVYVMISEVCPSSWRCSTYSCFWQWSSRCTSKCWTGWYYCLPAYENHGLWNATVVWSERAMYSVYANLMIHYTLHTIIGIFFFVSTTLSSEHINYKQVMRLFAFLFQTKLDLSITQNKKTAIIWFILQVWAVNGAGRGTPANVTHCFSLQTPQISCTTQSQSAITTVVNVGHHEDDGYLYNLRITYHDIEGIEHYVLSPVNNTPSVTKTCECRIQITA